MGWLKNTFKAGDPIRTVPTAAWCNYVATWLDNVTGIDGVNFISPDANGYGAAFTGEALSGGDTADYDSDIDLIVYVDRTDTAVGLRYHVPGIPDTVAFDTTYDMTVFADYSDTAEGEKLFVDLPILTPPDTSDTSTYITHTLSRNASDSYGWVAVVQCET